MKNFQALVHPVFNRFAKSKLFTTTIYPKVNTTMWFFLNYIPRNCNNYFKTTYLSTTSNLHSLFSFYLRLPVQITVCYTFPHLLLSYHNLQIECQVNNSYFIKMLWLFYHFFVPCHLWKQSRIGLWSYSVV